MTPEAELKACKQALSQYRRAWRELATALPTASPGLAAEVFRATARRYALPVWPPADAQPTATPSKIDPATEKESPAHENPRQESQDVS